MSQLQRLGSQNLAALLEGDDRTYEEVDVPEWGVSVRIRSLSGAERDAYENSIIDVSKNGRVTRKLDNFRTKLLVRAIVDDDGKPLFKSADIEGLASKNSGVLGRLFTVAQRLSGLEQNSVEEEEKGLGEAEASGDSGSG